MKLPCPSCQREDVLGPMGVPVQDPPEWVDRQRGQFREWTAPRGRAVLERAVDTRLTEGAWVILKSHRLLVTDQEDVFAVAQADIVAVVDE